MEEIFEDKKSKELLMRILESAKSNGDRRRREDDYIRELLQLPDQGEVNKIEKECHEYYGFICYDPRCNKTCLTEKGEEVWEMLKK